MKKKLLTMFAAALLVVTSAMPVMALPSVQAPAVSIISATDASGKAFSDLDCHDIKVRDIKDEDKASADEVVKPDNLKDVLGDNYVDGLHVISMADIYVVDEATGEELEGIEGAEYHFPITVKFNVPGVKAGDTVRVLVGFNGEWSEVEVLAVGDNTVEVKLNHVSPIIFLVDGEVAGELESPQTGEMNVMLYAGLIAAAAFAGAALLRRRTA